MNPSFCRCLALMPLLALAGCGGGTSPNPDTSEPVTISNAISNGDFRDDRNNRYYDIYVVDPTRSADVSVEMRSDDIDSLLLLYRKDSDGEFDLVAEDDDSGGELDAALDFRVERGESYRIVATTAQADERGEYEVRFSPELGRPALVLPKTNAQTQGMDLPPVAPKKK